MKQDRLMISLKEKPIEFIRESLARNEIQIRDEIINPYAF